MFKGQPKKPLFKVGDTVHAILNPKDHPKQSFTTSTARKSSFSSASRATKPTPLSSTAGLDLPPSTLMRITAVEESETDKAPHKYTLTPVTTPSFTVPESSMIPSSFTPGSFVVKKDDLRKELGIVRDVSVAVKEGADGEGEYVVLLRVVGEIGDSEIVEAGRFRAATAQEAKEWFPMGE